MTRTPEGEPDVDGRRPTRRWPRLRLPGWARRDGIARFFSRIGMGRGRLLFLDDDPRRAKLFLERHPPAVWVTNVPDCIAQLAGRWDEVHLDHDLGGQVYVDSDDADCGMEVIRWLCHQPRRHLRKTRFFVHTHNETAGLLMVLLMQSAGYRAEFRPFGLDLEELLAHNEPGAAGGIDDGAAPPVVRPADESPPIGQPALPESGPTIQPPPRTNSP